MSVDPIEAAVAEARQSYAAANPASRLRHEQAARVMPGGSTRSVLFYEPFPLGIARGEGARIWDADGHEYLDLLGEFTAGLAGHSNPVIQKAVREALDGGINLSAHNLVEARFAAAVAERFPSLELLRFTNSGTEANLMAVSTARVTTGREKVLAFAGGYHGGLLTFKAAASPINAPFPVVVGTYNDVEGTAELLDRHGPELAAVLVEPMQGSSGCIPATPEFLGLLRERTERYGAALIFDEVMTSRLGHGGRQSELGIRPDLTTLGKYIGGGMSFGAFGGRQDLMRVFDAREPGSLPHAGTFNNNVVTMTAGLAAMTEVFTLDALDEVNARGERLRADLNAVIARAGVPMQFTGLGSLMCAHFTAEPIRSPADLAGADPRLTEIFFFDLLAAGVHLARRGMIALSLPVSDDDTKRFVEVVSDFVANRTDLLALAAQRAG